ncbi:MAG: hypothetical protein ACYDBQ_05895 [Thermoplasmatota archaeon]
METELGDPGIHASLSQASAWHPPYILLRGIGAALGKTSWLALALDAERGFGKRSIRMDPVRRRERDVARLTLPLEAMDRGAASRPLR